jgi:outer membrane protein TolC
MDQVANQLFSTIFIKTLKILTILALASCTVTPKELTKIELKNSAKIDKALMFGSEVELVDNVSLEEAIARALKYNLDSRARSMEQALTLNQLDLDNYQLLPSIAMNAGYSDRSGWSATNSQTLKAPPPSSQFSVGSDKRLFTGDFSLSWNVLDFGLSYYNARQNADRSLIAEERRRKVVESLTREVQFSYWRMVAAQKLEKRVKFAITRAEQALSSARKVEKEKLKNPTEILVFQKQLLQKLRRVETVNQVLASARIELAALINVPPLKRFRVVPPSSDTLVLPKWTIDLEKMERMAFQNSPDIREKLYLSRISINDAKKSLITFLPGIELNGGRNYNSNSFMDSNRWFEWSSTLSLKVLKLLSLPKQLKYNSANKALLDAQRIALRMAVLAQVHVADLNYANAVKQYNRANELYKIDERLTKQIAKRQESDIQSMLERVSQETASIESVMRRYQTYSEVVAAVGRLHSTLGMGILKVGVHSNGLKDLTRDVGEALKVRMSGASIEAELDLFKTKTVRAKPKTIDIKKRNVVFIKEKQGNVVNENLFMYPNLSNIFGAVDVPKIKEVKGHVENYEAPSLLRGLAAGLDSLNKTLLSGLAGVSNAMVPVLDQFSDGIVVTVLDQFSDEARKRLENPEYVSP